MEKGLVINSTGSWYLVRLDSGETVECRIRGRIRMQGIRLTNPVAVGDVVDVDRSGADYTITSIHERKNYIIRKSVNLSKEAHIIAANVDLAVLVTTVAHPEVPIEFVDRFLVIAEAYSIPVLLLFNKSDLFAGEQRNRLDGLKELYGKIGYRCLEMSCVTREGLESLKEIIRGKTVVFSGMSGVGKSSVINVIAPSLNRKVSLLSDVHDSGKHTTTFAEMSFIGENTAIIDTPGIRSLGMVDMTKEELCHYFPEIFRVSRHCRFADCSHTHEPGCAVLKALETGEIALSRYESYLDMYGMDSDGRYR